jgi:hypothetical protein
MGERKQQEPCKEQPCKVNQRQAGYPSRRNRL